MTRTEIESMALGLLRDHGMLEMAVDPVRLAGALNVKVFNAKFGREDVVGLVARRAGGTRILVNVDDRPQRKRFTVAHELGHYLLHLKAGSGEYVDPEDNFRTYFEPTDWTEERRKEWEANAFAAALLMPEPTVRTMWERIRNIEGMAEWFQVSKEAMTYRLETLGLVEHV
jgi:Zn-dependent peptidase ImmA (M78 family)